MLKLKWLYSNSHGQEYTSWTFIDAALKGEVDEILEVVENGGSKHPKFRRDDSKEPEEFGYAGGFCSDLLEVADDKGADRWALVEDWYGPPRRKKK